MSLGESVQELIMFVDDLARVLLICGEIQTVSIGFGFTKVS